MKDIKPTNRKKLKLFLSTILATLILAALAFLIYGIYTFFTNYGIQSPVVLRSPIYPLRNEVLVSPMATGSGKQTMIFDVGKIAAKIYTLESSDGKNDGCRKLGLYNGYGFRQNSFEWICYPSHEAVRAEVINWLTEHIKNGDIASALCMYNQGKVTNECTYAFNYKSL